MRGVPRAFVFLVVAMLGTPSFGGGGAVLRNLEHVFRAGKYVKPARIATLTAKDLGYASKVDNVNGLLELAQQENRIDPIEMMRLATPFTSLSNGDAMLLACLQTARCQPRTFLEIAKTSGLHAEVVARNPAIGLVQAHHLVGAMSERLMIRYFEHSGWTRINGQVGRAGFDGLFVKYENGVIKDVLIVESKYNTSSLGTTNHGIQMSETWVNRKLAELLERYPDNDVYRKIEPFIRNSSYRAVVWTLKVERDSVLVRLSKVKSKGGAVDLEGAVGTDVEDFSSPFVKSMRLGAPRNKFEERFLGWYKEELDGVDKGITLAD
jgi:hypothetical protein